MATFKMHSALLLFFLHFVLIRAQSRENSAQLKRHLINHLLQRVDGGTLSEERLRTLYYILKLNPNKPSGERFELDGRQKSQSFQKSFINRMKTGQWKAKTGSNERNDNPFDTSTHTAEGIHKILKGYHKSRDRGSHAVLSSRNRGYNRGNYQLDYPLSGKQQSSQITHPGVPWYLKGDPQLEEWSSNYLDYTEDNLVTDDYYDPLDLSGYSYEHYDIEDLDYEEYIYYPHEEVCPTRKTWLLLNETINQRGQPVRVLPNTTDGSPQYVYVYKCEQDECKRCKGVHQNSRCVMRESFLKLYHEILDIEEYGAVKYDYVSVPTHCTCELLPDHFRHENCLERGKRENKK